MHFRVVYDGPDRLRLRMGRGAFSAAQGYGIEMLLLALPGVNNAITTTINGGILVEYADISPEGIIDAIRALNPAALPEGEARIENQISQLNDDFFHSITALLAKYYLMKFLAPAPIRIISVIWRGFGYWRKGFAALLKGRLGVDMLDASAVSAAMAQGEFGTAASVMTLLKISELLENYTREKGRHYLTRSLALNIDSAWVVSDGEDELVPINRIALGDRIRIRTGGVIPLDCLVVQGEALVNESSMTGEPLATLRSSGQSVYAGTVVEEGSLVAEVKALSDDTRIARIISLIDNSESLKAELESKAERLADAVVPFSFLASALTLLLTRNTARALSVLMVDYSCAIKLTTPICIISAMREAAGERILVKGGRHLEVCANVDTLVFDKTGTLTAACPTVARVVPLRGRARDEVLRISACLEEHFPHSVARAIVRRAEMERLHHSEEHADVKYVVAHGVKSLLHGEEVLIGSSHFIFGDCAIPLTEEERLFIETESNGYSTVFLAIGGEPAGMICVDDPVRKEAAEVIHELRELGLESVVMLTGDGEAAAVAASEALGITEYRAQVLPENKAKVIRGLRAAGRKVMMVGDGINDAPALSSADISVAMKDGSDMAREIADIALLSEDLNGLVKLRILSSSLFSRIHKNYKLIVAINTSLLLLGVTGMIMTPTSAVLHNLSTMLLSISSAKRLLPIDDSKRQEQRRRRVLPEDVA